MQERNKAILIRLNDNEKKCLMQKSKECGLKMEPFIRQLIMDCEIKAKPTDEYVKHSFLSIFTALFYNLFNCLNEFTVI